MHFHTHKNMQQRKPSGKLRHFKQSYFLEIKRKIGPKVKSNGRKMDQNWTRKRAELDQKWASLNPKWTQLDKKGTKMKPKMEHKWIQSGPKN